MPSAICPSNNSRHHSRHQSPLRATDKRNTESGAYRMMALLVGRMASDAGARALNTLDGFTTTAKSSPNGRASMPSASRNRSPTAVGGAPRRRKPTMSFNKTGSFRPIDKPGRSNPLANMVDAQKAECKIKCRLASSVWPVVASRRDRTIGLGSTPRYSSVRKVASLCAERLTCRI